MLANDILKKLTTRNYLACLLGTLLAYTVYKGINDPALVQTSLENPLVTYIMGTFTSGVMLVLYFYFRKPQSKESEPTS